MSRLSIPNNQIDEKKVKLQELMDSQLSFTTFWQDIQHILLTTLNSVYKNANITASLVNSITLVYKKGDPKEHPELQAHFSPERRLQNS